MKRPDRLVVQHSGIRIDQYLAQQRPELSRGHWKDLIERGAVTIDGAARSADFKLKGGEIVRVIHPEGVWADDKDFESWVLHEDKDLLVLNKPAGLLMHPLGTSWLEKPQAALAEKEPNLAGILQRSRPALARVWRCGIVHRLDRLTSGVLLVAKNTRAQDRILRDFKERRISKLYRAVVRGAPANKTSRVQAPIGRKPGHRKVVVTQFGKAAETSFTVVETCATAAIVEARPLTGRTHQIRAHLALIGHPVAGDLEFEKDSVEPKAPRLLLHAYEITLKHPGTQKPVSYKAPFPADIRAFWAACRKI